MVMQIEHKDAIANLEGIVQVDGVDGVFIGPMDLSGSMGITGQLDHPKVVAALERYREVCDRNKIAAGMHIVRPTEANVVEAMEQGYTLIALGADVVFLDEGVTASLRAAGRK